MLALAYGKKDITFAIEKDEAGNDYVDMKPMFFTMDGDTVLDYDGHPVSGKILGTEGDYVIFEKSPTYAGGSAITYYLLDDGTGTYFAHKKNGEDYETVDFKKTVIGDIQDSSIIDNIYLGDALGVKVDANGNINQHNIIVSLAYGLKDVDWEVGTDKNGNPAILMKSGAKPRTIGELKERSTALINEIQIADIMSASPNDKIVMYLLYGKENVHYTLNENNQPEMAQMRILLKENMGSGSVTVCNGYGESLSGYTLDTVAKTYTDSKGTVYHYTETSTTTDSETNIQTTVCLLSDEAGNPVKYAPHNLGDLAGSDNLITNLTKRLSVADILGDNVYSNKFLKHIADCTINNMATEVLNLSIGEIFEADIYVAKNGDTDTLEGLANGVYKYTGETPFTAYVKVGSTETTTVYKDEFFEVKDGAKYIYTPQDSDIAPTWKYLLTDKETGVITTDYKASTDMNKLLGNMTHNVQLACLDDLHEDKIIDFGEDADNLLDSTVMASIGSYSVDLPDGIVEGTRLGELTTHQMLSYTSALLDVIALINANPS